MKENEFLDGISNIEADIVERFVAMDNKLQRKSNESKPKKLWLRYGAIAACLLIIVSAVAVPMLVGDKPDVIYPTAVKLDYTPVTFNANDSPEKLSGSNSEFIVAAGGGGGGSSPPSVEFRIGIAVKARVVSNYPDTYYKLDVSSEYRATPYRLIQMETIEVIHGENVPQYFLYLIDEYTFVDMSVYDSLIISMVQLGTENYVMKNVTQDKMEALELTVFVDEQYSPELGNIIAFTDGIFDESLWQNENWIYGYQFAEHYLDDPLTNQLVVNRGDDEEHVIMKINQRFKEYVTYDNVYSVFTLDDFTTQAARDVLEYVKPFENGVFSQTFYLNNGHGYITFRRYINGCQTEETIKIKFFPEEITYSEVSYSQEDMKNMENISVHLSEKAEEYTTQTPTPPHTDPEGKELLRLNLYAWYVKADGKIYGVIKTAWRYKEKDTYYIQYYDDSYILYDISESTAWNITRDDLVKIVGDRNVYMGEYGEAIKMLR